MVRGRYHLADRAGDVVDHVIRDTQDQKKARCRNAEKRQDYDVQDRVDLRILDISEWSDKEICYRNVNADGSVLVLVTRDLGFPKWQAMKL